MTDRESTLLAGRVTRIQQILGHPLPAPPEGEPVPQGERDHLREVARDLYWNELEWEKLTGEEQLDEEFLTEQAFPGFLAFTRGLLLEEVMPDSQALARPSPQVVEDLLIFLAGRVVELEEEAAESGGEDREHREAELKMSARLLDLVLYLHYQLAPEEVAKVEDALGSE
ncbi:hypothetical protein ACFL5A_03035 [Gemmatimonadota bacterium]